MPVRSPSLGRRHKNQRRIPEIQWSQPEIVLYDDDTSFITEKSSGEVYSRQEKIPKILYAVIR